MPGTLRFEMSDLKPIIEFADVQRAAGKPFVKPYQSETGGNPCLLLVHDQGVYLMSGATERQKTPDGAKCVVAYAEGCDPTKGEFDDWYDNARDIVGGDDFAEAVDLAFFADALRGGAVAIEIKMSKKTYRMRAVMPRRRTA